MTKYRTITWFVAVALLAVAATSTNVRSHSNGPAVALAAMSPNELALNVDTLPTEDFNDMSLVFPRGTDR